MSTPSSPSLLSSSRFLGVLLLTALAPCPGSATTTLAKNGAAGQIWTGNEAAHPFGSLTSHTVQVYGRLGASARCLDVLEGGVANVEHAVNNGVNFSDWGIDGGFSAVPMTWLLSLHPQLANYEQDFLKAAAQANPPIPPQLLVAICLQESNGGLNTSKYGGPFQFTHDGAWSEFGPAGGDRNKMADAAIGAANFIAHLLKHNGNDLNAALRRYNGPVSRGGLPQYQADIQAWMQGTLVYGNGV